MIPERDPPWADVIFYDDAAVLALPDDQMDPRHALRAVMQLAADGERLRGVRRLGLGSAAPRWDLSASFRPCFAWLAALLAEMAPNLIALDLRNLDIHEYYFHAHVGDLYVPAVQDAVGAMTGLRFLDLRGARMLPADVLRLRLPLKAGLEVLLLGDNVQLDDGCLAQLPRTLRVLDVGGTWIHVGAPSDPESSADEYTAAVDLVADIIHTAASGLPLLETLVVPEGAEVGLRARMLSMTSMSCRIDVRTRSDDLYLL
jgi:hypothetical protein